MTGVTERRVTEGSEGLRLRILVYLAEASVRGLLFLAIADIHNIFCSSFRILSEHAQSSKERREVSTEWGRR